MANSTGDASGAAEGVPGGRPMAAYSALMMPPRLMLTAANAGVCRTLPNVTTHMPAAHAAAAASFAAENPAAESAIAAASANTAPAAAAAAIRPARTFACVRRAVTYSAR